MNLSPANVSWALSMMIARLYYLAFHEPGADMPPGLRYFVVDAFTDRPFAGNPAAVVPLESWPADAWLQKVTLEMNLSETAYFVPNATGYELRWFTPKVEVDLCGHATLASSLVLTQQGKLLDGAEVKFSTRSGILKALRHGEHYQLDFPAQTAEPATPPAGLIESLGIRAAYVGRNAFDYLVEVESATVLRGLKPDFKRLATIECRGIIVTARSDDPKYDFVSRFFGPAAGVDEDPVTGSAHCCLAGYWGRRLSKTKLSGYQASARGGIVLVETVGDRVLLGGQGVIVAQGELLVSPLSGAN